MPIDNTPDGSESKGLDSSYSEAIRWDPEGLRKRIYNNDDLFSALLKSFLSDSPKNSETLLDAAQSMNLAELKSVSHLLKGVCGQLCTERLHQICVAIEQVSMTPAEDINKQQLDKLCTDFSNELEAVEKLFEDALNPGNSTTDSIDSEELSREDFLSQINQLQSKLDQSEYIDPDSLSPLKTAYSNDESMQNLVKRLIEEINLFDNAAASATLKEITAKA
jgi:HPt (histidine-containing phosphotransfer) domain-containing protein